MSRLIVTATAFLGSLLPFILDSALKGVVLLIAATLVSLALWKSSAATRHLVWLVAVVALLVMPVLSLALPQWRVLPMWTGTSEREISVDPTIAPAPSSVPATSSPAPFSPALEIPLIAETELPLLPAEPPSPIVSHEDDQVVIAGVPTESLAESPTPSSGRSWVPMVWILGCSLLTLRLLASHFLLRRTSRRCVVLNPNGPMQMPQHQSIARLFTACREEIGLRQRVNLLLDPKRTIPIAWGVFRPHLLLPAASVDWEEEQIRSVLLHELAHLKRRDPLVQWLTQLACALHWWNPLVWFAAWRVHVERERACDDLVLASGVRPSVYAKHLLEVATHLSPAPWTQGCGLAMARKSSLEGRLHAVLSGSLNRRGVSRVLAAVALTLGALVAIPLSMLHAADETAAKEVADSAEAAEPVAPPIASAAPVEKRPLRKGAYSRMDVSLLKRWEMLDGKSGLVSETRLAGLRSAIDRFIKGIDTSYFSLTAEQTAALRALQSKDSDRDQHRAEDAGRFVKAVLAIHGEPIQMAFNETPMPGRVQPAGELAQHSFGPAAPNGLRVAISCGSKQFIFGDTARLDLRYWNTGKETLVVGIGRDTPGLYPMITPYATGSDGRVVKFVFGPDGKMLADLRFTKTWQLRPGESVQVFGYLLRVGLEAPRLAAHWPEWYTPLTLTGLQSGEEVTLSVSLPYPHAPGTPPAAAAMQTGNVKFKVMAPEDIAIWSAHGAGQWPMPGGVTMEVKQECFHGADIATSAVLTWPKDDSGITRAYTIGLATDAFANRDPWHLVWEKNATELWTMSGQLQGWRTRRTELPTPHSVSRIDFSDRMKVTTTTWSYFPKEIPEGVRTELLTVFKPLADQPRSPKEASGSVFIKPSHDIKPIAELLNGVWKNKGGNIEVGLTFPEHETGKIQWTIDFKRKADNSVVTASLSRIRSPADNSIGLYVSSNPMGHLDDEDILGNLRRGPGNTLLLEVKKRAKYPDYDAVTGIVLERISRTD